MRPPPPARRPAAPAPAPVPPARRAAIRRRLLAWYDAGHRRLPWRLPQDRADPYRVWLAEVMLQQTRVAAVLPFYRRFVERWPSLEALAAAPEEAVLAAWSGLGYYARCRNLLAAAREALRRHGGLPASQEALLRLPGLGRYTAGAVASIAFGLAEPAVDGNAARALSRLFLVEGRPEDPRRRRRLWALAAALVPPSRPGDFNQALMELGAMVCGPLPDCSRCPLAARCAARAAGREREVPASRRRPVRRRLAVACAVVERDGRLLLARREGRGLFGGMWELPAAELSPGEDARLALRAALAGRLGVAARVGGEVGAVRRTLTHRELTLRAYRCRVRGRPRALGYPAVAWKPRAALRSLAMSEAMRRLVAAVGRGPVVAVGRGSVAAVGRGRVGPG